MGEPNGLLLFLYLVFTFAIGWVDAYQGGKFWTETKITGGWPRVVLWSALIMAVIAFTWVFMTVGAIIGFNTGAIIGADAEFLFKVGYVILIPALIGSGFVLWVNSLVVAWRKRTLGTSLVAGYNTFAQFHNTWQAASHVPDYLGDVADGIRGRRRKSDLKLDGLGGLAVLLIFVIALTMGIALTFLIARHSDRQHALDVTAQFDM